MSLTDRFQQLRGGTLPTAQEEKPGVDVFALHAQPATLGRILEAKTAAESQSSLPELQQTASLASVQP